MTKTELRHIVENLIEELRELPDGYKTTSGRLLAGAGYDLNEMETEDLYGFHEELLRISEDYQITLDMSKYEFRREGLPWNLEFVVRNIEAQIKCPFCGSTDTARILYGKPFFSDELQKKLDAGKLRLGGCCINVIEAEDGTMVRTDPEWYCNHCGKGFDVEPRRQND